MVLERTFELPAVRVDAELTSHQIKDECMTPKELKREGDRLRDEMYRAYEELILAAKKGGKKRLRAGATRWEMFHHALDRLVGQLRESKRASSES